MLTQHGIMFNDNANQEAKIHANQSAASQRKLPRFLESGLIVVKSIKMQRLNNSFFQRKR